MDSASHEGSIHHYQHAEVPDAAAVDAALHAKFGSRHVAQHRKVLAVTCTAAKADDSKPITAVRAAETNDTCNSVAAARSDAERSVRQERRQQRCQSEERSAREAGAACAEGQHELGEQQQQQQERGRSTCCREEPVLAESLVLMSVERVAPLSVLDGDALLPGSSGALERVLTGFQV